MIIYIRNMNKGILIVVGVISLVIVGVVGWQTLGQKDQVGTKNSSQNSTSGTITNSQFQNPKKSAHYESNTPAHGATLAGVPINVVIDFNFDLAKPSAIQIFHDGTEYGTGETK